MKKLFYKAMRLLYNLLFPPKCVGCGELYQKDIFDECQIPFCEKCRLKWEYEKLDRCPDCELEMTICSCGSRLLKKLEVDDCVKLINYTPMKNTVGRSAILTLKRKKKARAFNYFATQLSFATAGRIAGFDKEKTIITYVPRHKKGIAVYGFDQSKELAKRLSEELGIKSVPLFLRTRKKTGEQKKLTLSERLKNANGTYKFNRRCQNELDGVECIVLLDDILTSGASLSGCVLALKPVFKGKIVPVTLGRTGKKGKK